MVLLISMMKMKPLLILTVFCFTYSQLVAQLFIGNGGPIPDNAPAIGLVLPVTGLPTTTLNGSYGLKRVCLSINHTYNSDLVAKLVSPDGSSIQLFSNVGGGDDNFTNTCFDSNATVSINQGTAPFTGVFRPQGNMGNVNNGQNGNGNWILYVQDVVDVDTGVVVSWSIEFGANAPTPLAVVTNIPLVVIESNGISNSYSGANMKIIDNGIGNLNYPYNPGNVYTGKVRIKIRGAFSSSLPQKPYAFTTMESNLQNDSNVVLLGLPKEHDWILLATYNDKSFVRNPLMYEVFRDMNHYAARSKYVEVVLDGEYQGIYSLMEKVKRDSQRVSIPKLTLADTSGDNLTGGYIIKHDYPDQGWTSNYTAQPCAENYQYNFEYPSGDSILPQQANYIENYMDSLEDRLYSTQYKDSLLGYRPFVHLNSFIDYMLVNEASWNWDGFKKSMFFFKEKDSKDHKLHAGPVWDFDWGLKITPYHPADLSGWNYMNAPCSGDVLYLPWWDRMMQDTFFQNKTKCRWEFHRKYSLHLDTLNHFIDAQVQYLQQAQARHYAYWQTLGINVGTPEITPAMNFPDEIDSLKAFLKRRIEWIDVNLPGICTNPIFPSSVEEEEVVNDVIIFPNPGSNELTIRSSQKITSLTMMDNLGRLVQPQWDETNGTVSVIHIPNGHYFIRLHLFDGQVVGHMVEVQH